MSAQNGSFIFKSFVPKGDAQARSTPKRTRPRVPDDQRKRVRLACENCRQKKEKCDGDHPCKRCTREDIVCKPWSTPSSTRMRKDDRMERLEKVTKHVLGVSSLNDEELRAISDSIGTPGESSGEGKIQVESSLSTFSHQLEQKLGQAQSDEASNDKQQQPAVDAEDDALVEFCRSPSPTPTAGKRFLDSILEVLPPRSVAEGLVHTCFEKVQCNSFYAREMWAYELLQILYTNPSTMKEQDCPKVASLCMIMALGSQFCCDPSLTYLGPLFYERTITLIPELISRSNFECIRACLLLATYLFPVDLPGTAYTYLGLALHMALRNKMHQKCHDEVEIRVWWTIYTFYQRARIFHGYPRTLSYRAIGIRGPLKCIELEPKNGISNFCNQIALIEITVILENVADEIASLRRSRKASPMAKLLSLRRKLIDFTSQLPSLPPTERIETSIPRLRLDIHMYLHYWHARLYLGRPFLLEKPNSDYSNSSDHVSAGELFAQDSVHAATNIIELCQTIHDKIGLSQASYATEFTSCRAAMLVLIAKGITDRSATLSNTLAQGLSLIQHMSLGQGQASSEARVIEVLQRAITRLHKKPLPASSNMEPVTSDPGTDQLRLWEELWQEQSPSLASMNSGALVESYDEDPLAERTPSKASFHLDGPTGPTPSEQDSDDIWSTIFNYQLNEFSLISFDTPEQVPRAPFTDIN